MPFHLREKLAPEVEGKHGGTPAEDANKVILESLVGISSHVVTMVVGGEQVRMSCPMREWLPCTSPISDCPEFDVWGHVCFLHAFQGSCWHKNKFTTFVVLEGLYP